MKLFTQKQSMTLFENGCDWDDDNPVVKLFLPDGSATWLLTSSDPSNEDIVFGIVQYGSSTPEFRPILIDQLLSVRDAFGHPIKRDTKFKASKTTDEYLHDLGHDGKLIC